MAGVTPAGNCARTSAFNHSLRREAEWTYGEVLRIMRTTASLKKLEDAADCCW